MLIPHTTKRCLPSGGKCVHSTLWCTVSYSYIKPNLSVLNKANNDGKSRGLFSIHNGFTRSEYESPSCMHVGLCVLNTYRLCVLNRQEFILGCAHHIRPNNTLLCSNSRQFYMFNTVLQPSIQSRNWLPKFIKFMTWCMKTSSEYASSINSNIFRQEYPVH